MTSVKSISHEQLASLWLALSNSRDLGAQICESSGHYALEPVDQEQSTQWSRSLLAYAIELTIIFDFIRASNSRNKQHTNIESNEKEHRYISRALAYLLRKIEPQSIIGGAKCIAYGHILLRSVLSGLCALCALPGIDRTKEIKPIALAAQDLAARIPQEGDDCLFLRDLSWYMIAVSSSDYQGSRNHPDCALRRNSCYLEYQAKSEVVEQFVDLATNLNTNPIERIKAILELCNAYLESDAALVRSCGANNSGREAQTGLESVQVMASALETRYLIQEHLMNASLETTSQTWVQAMTPSLLMPSMSQSCALDACQCIFGVRHTYILEKRKQRSKFLRHSLQKVFVAEITGEDLGFTESILLNFQARLACATSGDHNLYTNQPAVALSQLTLQTRTTMQCNDMAKTGDLPTPQSGRSPEQMRRSSSNLPRYYSQRSNIPGRSSSYPVNDMTAHKHAETIVPQSPPPLSDSGGRSSSQRSRSDSITTITSSRDGGHIMSGGPLLLSQAHQESQESYKIVVEAPRNALIKSPSVMEKSFPEVVVYSEGADNISLLSESSIPVTVFSTTHTASKGRWGNLLRGKRDASLTFNVPKFRFFASGKHILVWTKYGSGIIDPDESSGYDFIPVREADVTHAAGGTSKFVTISRIAENYRLSIYQMGNAEKIGGWDLPKNPGSIDLSRNDQYLAIKYTRSLHVYNLLQPGTIINHKLPSHDAGQPGPGNHIVSFSTDSQSFMAATRFQPERVYIYWSLCAQSTTISQQVATSTAPFGNVEDHGLTSLAVCSPTSRSCPNAFLSTFTEKGYPALVNMNQKVPAVRILRDHKDQIGTRIHDSALSMIDVDIGKADLVLVNQNNSVFWVSDVFGTNSDMRHITTLKRAKSLKNEVQIAVSDIDEASIFWIDKQTQKGVLVKVGKNGGKSNPAYYRLDVEPLCGG